MSQSTPTKIEPKWPLAVAAVAVAAAAITLSSMGRTWWCTIGDMAPWSFDIWSAHNSQHLLDPYTFTHILHGVLFYGVLRLVFGKERFRIRLMVAVVLESAWELIENSERVIQSYRESTISLDYYGDSVMNSMADIGAMVGGFFLASTLPVWGSVMFFIVVEVTLALLIRDSLILNIIMLTFPIEAIKDWQMGVQK